LFGWLLLLMQALEQLYWAYVVALLDQPQTQLVDSAVAESLFILIVLE